MPTYILQLPGSDFTGFRGGVDFYGGQGSTNSKADADRLIAKCGCVIIGPEPASEIKVEGASEEAPPAISTPDGKTPRDFVNKADREMHENTIRRLAGGETKTGGLKRGRKK